MSQADALRKQILALVADYGREASARITFVPGKTTIPPAGKMLGAAEFVNLVDAALDGWLTTGRFYSNNILAKQELCMSGSHACSPNCVARHGGKESSPTLMGSKSWARKRSESSRFRDSSEPRAALAGQAPPLTSIRQCREPRAGRPAPLTADGLSRHCR